MFFPMGHLHLLTPATHNSFVCIALQHYVLRLPPGASEKALVANGPKIWQYRGEAIRELSRRVADPRTMYSLATITSVVVFLTNEVRGQATYLEFVTHSPNNSAPSTDTSQLANTYRCDYAYHQSTWGSHEALSYYLLHAPYGRSSSFVSSSINPTILIAFLIVQSHRFKQLHQPGRRPGRTRPHTQGGTRQCRRIVPRTFPLLSVSSACLLLYHTSQSSAERSVAGARVGWRQD